MSSLQKTQFKQVIITPENEITFKKGGSEDTKKSTADRLDITPAVVAFDYYEDLLSPSISVELKISNTSALYSLVPIRGYERIDLKIGTAYGDITFSDEDKNPLYVVGIEGLNQTEGQEIFTLKCCTLENLKNETARCQIRFPRAPIHMHIQYILEDILQVDSERISTIEDTVTPYGFIGNNRKPFHTCTWLCPKAVPSTAGVKGTTESTAKGTAGYLFYENYDGFNFRSVDKMIDATQAEYPTSSKDLQRDHQIDTYTFSGVISRGEDENEKQIISHYTDKTTNLQKNLRVGLYSNLTYFYNPLTWKVEGLLYNLKDELGDDNVETAGTDVPIPQGDISKFASRVLVRIGDTGMWDPTITKSDEEVMDSGRDNADMAKSFSRYTLLFQQSLNIIIPCNINLRVGQVIKIVFPQVGPEESGGRGTKQGDKQLSGFYLIRALRHHFEINEGTNITSLNLIRDSYGIQ